MAHHCPNCGAICYCDMEDCLNEFSCDIDNCTHCPPGADRDDYEDYEFIAGDEEEGGEGGDTDRT